MKVDTQIKALLKVLSDGIYEKEHILAMALLSAIAGESIFLLGPPGTAKSLVSRRLKLAFKDGNAFEYLMSRFSTPDEIFGPVSISLLKNEDRYERVVDGFLPTATIVFLDEIWKASPSIQNALLTAINERIFQNGSNTIQLPMKGLIAASNELPAEEEGLEALWDRFLVRMISNCIQNENTFYKMIRQQKFETPNLPDECLITEEQYQLWKLEIKKVCISDEICTLISYIRKYLTEESKKEGINKMDFYISDRRWKKCVHLMQTSAFLNGRKAIDITDCMILVYCLWNKSETIPAIIDVVCRSLTSVIDARLDKFEKEIEQALKNKSAERKETGNDRDKSDRFALTNFFYYSISNFPNGKCLFFKTDYNHVSIDKLTDGILYYDENKKSWIVHAIYTGAPFDYKTKSAGDVRKVKLLKCNGGVIIDGIPFAFEKSQHSVSFNVDLFDDEIYPKKNVAERIAETISTEIRNQLSDIQNLFAKSRNIFLSDNDIKLAKKYISECDKRINEVLVKAQNTQELL